MVFLTFLNAPDESTLRKKHCWNEIENGIVDETGKISLSYKRNELEKQTILLLPVLVKEH